VLRNNTAHGNGRNAIGVFGYYVSRTGTWVHDNLPYTIYEEAQINTGVTLTIEPGTVIQFERVYDGLYVDGTLIARGTALEPILFTSEEVVKEPGQWRGMSFRSTASTNSIMENCIVECAASPAGGNTANIRFDSAPALLLTNCTIRSSAGNGLAMYFSDPRVFGCVFTNNGATNSGAAIAMRADCLPLLRNNSAQGNGRNAIAVFGYYLSRTGTWVRDNLPYTIYEEAQVNNGVTLTIEPGTVIQFERVFDGLYVDGTLLARGTPLNPIVFTSDDASKQPGQWRGIDIRATATNTILENCTIEYGGSVAGGFNAGLRFDAAPTVLVTHGLIRSSPNDGIYCNLSSPLIGHCRIESNARDGVRAVNGSSPVLTNCAISANSGFGVNNLDPTRIILAQGNYWGHPSGPYDNANIDGLGLLNPSGLGDKVSEYVNWGQPLASDPTEGESPLYLTIARAGNQVILSWPGSVSGYSLQAVTNLSTGAGPWLPVTNPVVDFGGNHNVNDNLSESRKFYRLSR
jgi:predicted outer membrane repeat protein